MQQPEAYLGGAGAAFDESGKLSEKTRPFLQKFIDEFAQWVARAKAGGKTLDRAGYMKLVTPSERDPVQYFAAVEPDLYDRILNRCVEDGKMCMHHMMAIDANGGRANAVAKGLSQQADVCTVQESVSTVAALDKGVFLSTRYRP